MDLARVQTKKSPDNKTNNDSWGNDLLETHVMFYSIIGYSLLCKSIFGSSFLFGECLHDYYSLWYLQLFQFQGILVQHFVESC